MMTMSVTATTVTAWRRMANERETGARAMRRTVGASALARNGWSVGSNRSRARRTIAAASMIGTDVGGGGRGAGGDGRGDGRGGRGDGRGDGRGRDGRRAVSLACSLAASVMFACDAARAAAKKPVGKGAKEPTLDALDFGALFSRQMGISGVVGLGAGMAIKSLGSKILITVASFVALLRWLELNDLVDVKWENVHAIVKSSSSVLDVNKDGKVDEHDFFAIKAKVINFYTSAVPSAAGFTAGFAAGLSRF